MSDYASTTALFALAVSTNYLGDLYNCEWQSTFKNNYVAKHLVGFFALLFAILITNTNLLLGESLEGSWLSLYVILKGLLIYTGFLAFTKSPMSIGIFVVAIFVFILFLTVEKTNKSNEMKEIINHTINVSLVFGMILLIGGSITSYNKERNTRTDLQFVDFMLELPKCNG